MLPSCSRKPDKYGRRAVLIITLVLMGVGTSLAGLLSTYASIGIGLRFSWSSCTRSWASPPAASGEVRH